MPVRWTAVKQRGKNGQSIGNVDERVQNMEDKPRRNDELKKLEDALPRPKVCDLEKAWTLYKAKTGVGCDGFHPKVSLDFDKRNKRRSNGILGKVETKWQMTATSLHDVVLDTEERYK